MGTWRHVLIIRGKGHISVQSLWSWLNSEIFPWVASTVNLTSLSPSTTRIYLTPLPPRARRSLRKAKGIRYYQCAALSDMNSFVFLKMTYQHEQSWLAHVWIVLHIPFLSSPELKNVLSPSLFPLFVCVFLTSYLLRCILGVTSPVKTREIQDALPRLSAGHCVGWNFSSCGKALDSWKGDELPGDGSQGWASGALPQTAIVFFIWTQWKWTTWKALPASPPLWGPCASIAGWAGAA